MDVDKIIDRTVNKTILKLKMAGLMRDTDKTAAQKTEELLKNYKSLKLSDQPYAKKLVSNINEALETIRDDPYYAIIPLYYFSEYSREYVAYELNTTPTTISRNKARLIDKLKVILYSEEYISELFL